MSMSGDHHEQAGEMGLQVLLHRFACLLRDWRLTPGEAASLLQTSTMALESLVDGRRPDAVDANGWERLRHCLALGDALGNFIGLEEIPRWLRAANPVLGDQTPLAIIASNEAALAFLTRILVAELDR